MSASVLFPLLPYYYFLKSKVLNLLHFILATVLLVGAASIFLTITEAVTITPQDNAAKRQINNFFEQVAPESNNISKVTINLFNDTNTYTLTRQYQPESPTTPPLPTPTEICGNGIDDDKDGQIDEGCPIPPTTGSVPAPNSTKFFRIWSSADIDDNSGLNTQAKLAKKYGAQIGVIHGDLDYNSIGNVFNRLAVEGYDKTKLVVADGNHDSCTDIRNYLGVGSCFYEKLFAFGKVSFLVLKGSDVGCTSQQFTDAKTKLEASNALYNVISIHEPFATVKSDHGPNGGFSCFHPLFKANGVDLVLQGHNHNYQHGVIDNLPYAVHGTGTHDEGSSMYGCDSSSFNSVTFKCITGTNGIVIIDFQIDGKANKINGYYVSNADKLVHTFTSGGN